MKQFFLILLMLAFCNRIYSQWITKDPFIEGYRIIGADDHDDPDFKHVPLVDSNLLTNNKKEMQQREFLFYNAIDSLKKYNEYPNLMEYDISKIIDSIPEKELDSIKMLNNIYYEINSNYLGRRNAAFRVIFKYPSNKILVTKHNDFLVSELRKTMFVENFGRIQYKLYFTYLKIPDNLTDSINVLGLSDSSFIDAKWGDTIAENKVIKEFWEIVKDTIDDKYYKKYNDIKDKTLELFIIDSKKTWDTFFQGLQSNVAYYKFISNDLCTDMKTGEFQVEFSVESLASRLLTIYNEYFYNDIEYFRKYVLQNLKIDDYTVEMYYLQAIEDYFSKKYNREIKMKLYDTEWSVFYPRDEFEKNHTDLPYKK